MPATINKLIRPFKGSSTRTFFLYPFLIVGGALLWNEGRLPFEPVFLPVAVWGYLQYRLCGKYRIRHGGGGPGMDTPPERLVTTGPFAYSRNPMYIGHIIFLLGMALTFHSLLAVVLAAGTAIFFHSRIARDERRLVTQFGESYIAYSQKVKRWLPGLF